MFKFVFTMLTDPLTLPINPLWEYLILAILGAIAFQVGWEVSPGGMFGSLIHWTVRLAAFASLWAITYVSIVVVQWVCANWFLILSVLGRMTLIVVVAVLVMRLIKQRKSTCK